MRENQSTVMIFGKSLESIILLSSTQKPNDAVYHEAMVQLFSDYEKL